MVAKGFYQEEGVDFFETFSPVVRPTTIRIVLTVVVSHGWPLWQLDVQNTFLHGDLHETVFLHQPPGFVDSSHPHHVCRLSKALYGLKQSPRAWFHTLSSSLLDHSFIASHYDPSLFILSSHASLIFVLVYVYDIIVTGSNSTQVSSLISALQQKFALKDLGPLHFFLGIEVTTNQHGLSLSQNRYIKDLFSSVQNGSS